MDEGFLTEREEGLSCHLGSLIPFIFVGKYIDDEFTLTYLVKVRLKRVSDRRDFKSFNSRGERSSHVNDLSSLWEKY